MLRANRMYEGLHELIRTHPAKRWTYGRAPRCDSAPRHDPRLAAAEGAEAAIDAKRLAGDPAVSRIEQEFDGVGDVGWLA